MSEFWGFQKNQTSLRTVQVWKIPHFYFEGFPNSSPAYRRSCVHEGAGVGDGQRGGARQPGVRGGLQPARPVRVDQGRRGTNHILFL